MIEELYEEWMIDEWDTVTTRSVVIVWSIGGRHGNCTGASLSITVPEEDTVEVTVFDDDGNPIP